METNRNGYQGSQGGRQDWTESRGQGRMGQGQGGRDDSGRGDLDQGRMQFGDRSQERMGQMGLGRMGMGAYGQDNDYGRSGSFDQGRDDERMGQGSSGRMGQGSFGRGEERGRGAMGQSGSRRTRWQREPMTARDIMTSPVRSVNAQSSIRDIAQIMKDENVGIVPVVDDSRRLVGVVTDRDLVVRALAGDASAVSNLKIQDLMTDDVEAVAPDEELREVIELMGKRQVRRIPVVDEDDTLLGIISLGDIANRADYDEELQDALEQISAKRSFWNRRWL